jgi:glycosyltransferase involved in cell wall biosynthesis
MEQDRAMTQVTSIDFNSFINGGLSKKSVLLRGPLLTQSGYGVHARQFARWAFKKNDWAVDVQALPWGDTPWLIDKDLSSGLIGEILEKTTEVSPNKKYDISIQIQLPNEWDPNIAKTNFGVTAGVETDICNPEWIRCCNRMTAVIVPSNHVKACLEASGKIDVPLLVIPEAYCDEILRQTKTSVDDMTFSTPFNFLVLGQLTGSNPEDDRKNIFYTIKWFCEVFKDDPEVGLVIKTNMGRNTKLDKRNVTQLLQNLLKEVRQGDLPRVHLIHGELSDQEISSLYRHTQIKALVSLTRGEGYGLPILEAAASGLPVIATGWSGHMDFMKHGKFVEVGYKIDKIHPTRADGNIFVQNSKWAHPSEEDFKKKIIKFRSSSSVPKEWAASLSKTIIEKYSQEAIERYFDDSLKVIE